MSPPPFPPACRLRRDQTEQQPLLPGLPDHLAQICLSRLPAPLLYSVCRAWRRLLYSPSFPPFLSLYALLSHRDHGDNSNNNLLLLHAYDPLSSTWHPLPSPPTPHPILHHPSFLSRPFPLQTLSTPSLLLLLAASSPRLLPALPSPLAFHPPSSSWRALPALSRPRRWCAAAADLHHVYIFSGISADYSSDVARSAEHLDTSSSLSSWRRIAPLPDSRFCRDPIDAVVARGKVYLVNASGCDGAAYNIFYDRWEDMPRGMLEGWTGPAVVDAGRIYVLAEDSLREYDWREDTWREIAKDVALRGAQQAAAGGGRVCAVVDNGAKVAVVDGKGRVELVEPPEGKRVVAVHVLPRPSYLVD